MNRRDDFWLDILQWVLGIVALALVGSIVLHSIECAAAIDSSRGSDDHNT